MPIVTPRQLATLSEALEEQQAPITARLNPGLSDGEIDRLCQNVGIDLPDEPRTWWRWHNGASLTGRDIDSTDLLSAGPGNLLLPLELAIEDCLERRRIAAELKPDDPEYWWKPTWLPFTKQEYAFECHVPKGEPSPILDTDPMADPHNPGQPITNSFGEMVNAWIFALTGGVWFWDPNLGSGGAWNQDTSKVPSELMKLGLF